MKTDIIIDKRQSRTFVKIIEGAHVSTVEVAAPTVAIVEHCRERYGARLGTIIELRRKLLREIAAA